jgi:class II lanthipeptide synthase
VALAVTLPDVAEQARSHARAAATVLVDRHQATGRWFPDGHAADRHNLSLLTGLAAVAHAFLRCADPAAIASVRALE